MPKRFDIPTLERELHRRLVDRFNLEPLVGSKEQLLERVRPVVHNFVLDRNIPLNVRELDHLTSDIADEMLGIGPTEPPLTSESDTEIPINKPMELRSQPEGPPVRLRDGASVALSVVVPCYNELAGLGELHRRVTAACGEQVGSSYEIVLVNDGSTDGTRDAIFDLAARDDHIVGIDLARNYGHQIALSAGLEFCCGRRILILDADLQDPPELLGEMMAKMDDSFDVVYGQRLAREGESWFKRATASAFYRLLRVMVDVDIAPDTGDFRLMSRRALNHLNAMPERYRFIRGMVSWIGLKQAAVSYRRQRRFAGTTHYPLRKMVHLAVDAMTSFSIAPLRFASHLGMAFGIVGLLTLGHVLFSWFIGNVLPGWTSLAAIVLILGSVQLLVLGIFGEYLGRMYMEAKRRPLYIINEIARGSSLKAANDGRDRRAAKPVPRVANE